jgi:hypothetical protein
MAGDQLYDVFSPLRRGPNGEPLPGLAPVAKPMRVFTTLPQEDFAPGRAGGPRDRGRRL